MKKLKIDPNSRKKRHIELVKKYYPVDEENKIITLRLSYESAKEILDLDIGDKTHPSFKSETMEHLVDIINTFPRKYKVKIQFSIKDYAGYEPKALLEAFNDEFEFNHHLANEQSRKRWSRAGILIFAAAAVIIFEAVGSKTFWNNTNLLSEFHTLIFSTLSTLFIWEAGTILFLSPSNYRAIGFKIMTKVIALSFNDEKGNSLAEESNLIMIKDWIKGR